MLKLLFNILICWPSKTMDAEFDVGGVKVLGIERKGDETVISYYNDKGKLKEYFLVCSKAKHQQLVDRCRKQLDIPGKWL